MMTKRTAIQVEATVAHLEGDRVLIVGAGPVGLVCAARLTAMGVRPRVVDLLGAPSPLSKAVAVQRARWSCSTAWASSTAF
jgi:threonine dehydrogenase-like Zn-dependent dehydrogenase